jgi:transcription-repair coupling factor (superfamily II helicase)
MSPNIIDDFLSFPTIINLLSKINDKDKENNKIIISPLPGSIKSMMMERLLKAYNHIVLLFPDKKEVNETKVELDILGLGKNTITIDKFNRETLQEKLTDLNNRDQAILLSTYDLFKVKLPSKEKVEKTTTLLEVGSGITYDELLEYLSVLEYQKDKFVDGPGEYSTRGSIIDFWSYSEKQPCRLEYDGDFLESIRYFDIESQRSLGREQYVTLASLLLKAKSKIHPIYLTI